MNLARPPAGIIPAASHSHNIILNVHYEWIFLVGLGHPEKIKSAL
jgi:hypothetical protein